MSDDLQTVRALIELLEATPLDGEDQLSALELTWIMVAGSARAAALAVPGGFPAEKNRQVERLARIGALISADEPEMELERMCQEGDVRGVRDWTRRAMGKPGAGS